MTVMDLESRILEIRSMLGLTKSAPATDGSEFAATLRSTLNSPDTTLGNPAKVTGADVVSAAGKYLGTPYTYGSNTPENGLDCSGLVQRAYADLGVQLPRVAADQAREGTAIPALSQARPGDLLAFDRPVDHIGIYIGGNKMIVAPHAGDVVKIQTVYETPTTIRRIFPSIPVADPLIPTAAMLRPAALNGSALHGSAGTIPFAELFQAAGRKYGLSPTLLAAVAKVESGYDPTAVSGAGAQGLMQLMPATARGLGVDAMNPQQAVDGAARMLSSNLKRFGTVDLALAAYNAGGGAVSRYGGIPPFAQTQAYIPKVKAAMEQIAGKWFA